ncbi:MAG: hypothetical protein PUA77_09595 [Lachnospiraceae bacterium]|nr:hypothetical protein [Agathobacter sp.]MDD6292017.1 hypothetical protein [Lachnospiraceae bacterium]
MLKSIIIQTPIWLWKVEVNVTFPDNYGSEELNGKNAVFEVTINGIYE